MVNETILDKIDFDKVVDPIKSISEFVKDKIAEIGIQFPQYLGTILTIFIGVLLIWGGTKIANKIAKFILWILGIILIVGIVLSFVAGL